MPPKHFLYRPDTVVEGRNKFKKLAHNPLNNRLALKYFWLLGERVYDSTLQRALAGKMVSISTGRIPEERLRLNFACCDPSLEPKLGVALTLRTVCGLTTPETARTILHAELTMGQRLGRARATIASEGTPFAVRAPELLRARLEAVPASVYLTFTSGHVMGPDEPRYLCLEAEYLMRLIDRLRRNDPEIEGAVAMLLLTAARPAARIG